MERDDLRFREISRHVSTGCEGLHRNSAGKKPPYISAAGIIMAIGTGGIAFRMLSSWMSGDPEDLTKKLVGGTGMWFPA